MEWNGIGNATHTKLVRSEDGNGNDNGNDNDNETMPGREEEGNERTNERTSVVPNGVRCTYDVPYRTVPYPYSHGSCVPVCGRSIASSWKRSHVVPFGGTALCRSRLIRFLPSFLMKTLPARAEQRSYQEQFKICV